MSLIKYDGGGYQCWKVITGDDEVDAEQTDQLTITAKELAAAINAQNVSDQLFARILKNRSKAHESLRSKIPGARDD